MEAGYSASIKSQLHEPACLAIWKKSGESSCVKERIEYANENWKKKTDWGKKEAISCSNSGHIPASIQNIWVDLTLNPQTYR